MNKLWKNEWIYLQHEHYTAAHHTIYSMDSIHVCTGYKYIILSLGIIFCMWFDLWRLPRETKPCSLLEVILLLTINLSTLSHQHFKHLTLGSIFADFEIQVAFKQTGTYYNITYIQTKENPEDKISVRLHCKSHQKSSKCQNLFTGWHLEFLGGTS